MKTAGKISKLSDLSAREETAEGIPQTSIIGNIDQIISICRATRVDRIVVALDEKRGVLPTEQLLFARLKGIRIDEGVTFTVVLSVEHWLPSLKKLAQMRNEILGP